MIETRGHRLLAVGVLCGALAGLMVWFGTLGPNPQLNHFLEAGHLAVDQTSHVGERAQVIGPVVDTDPVVIAAEYSIRVDGRYRTGTIRITITGLSQSVSPGQRLQVYGIVRPDRTIQATRTVAVPATNFLFMYGISALAGLWVLARLLMGWTVAWDEFAIHRRSDRISVFESIGHRRRTEDPDA